MIWSQIKTNCNFGNLRAPPREEPLDHEKVQCSFISYVCIYKHNVSNYGNSCTEIYIYILHIAFVRYLIYFSLYLSIPLLSSFIFLYLHVNTFILPSLSISYSLSSPIPRAYIHTYTHTTHTIIFWDLKFL